MAAIEPGAGCTINGRFLTQVTTGVQRYAREIVRELDAILSAGSPSYPPPPIQLVAPSGATDLPSFQTIETRTFSFGHGFLWDQCILPVIAKGGVLSLCNTGPLLARNHIICIHDLNTFVAPDSYSFAFRKMYQMLTPVLARRARRVVTVSHASAHLLAAEGLCPPEKTTVIPSGHEHVLRWDSKASRFSEPGAFSRPYVLLLGSRAKHKNVDVVLQSVGALNALGLDLVIAGGTNAIFAGMSPQKEAANVRTLGYVSDDDLSALFKGALCFVFPSTVEGFGIPALEAMALGCPVIASTARSLVEVCDAAALYADPVRPDVWVNQIRRILEDNSLRDDLRQRGRRRANNFSWRQSAQAYLKILSTIGTSTKSLAE